MTKRQRPRDPEQAPHDSGFDEPEKPTETKMNIRVEPELLETFRAAAHEAGLALSQWVRVILKEAAARPLQHAQVEVVSGSQSRQSAVERDPVTPLFPKTFLEDGLEKRLASLSERRRAMIQRKALKAEATRMELISVLESVLAPNQQRQRALWLSDEEMKLLDSLKTITREPLSTGSIEMSERKHAYTPEPGEMPKLSKPLEVESDPGRLAETVTNCAEEGNDLKEVSQPDSRSLPPEGGQVAVMKKIKEEMKREIKEELKREILLDYATKGLEKTKD